MDPNAATARFLLRHLRRRDLLFPGHCADPVWDMLLDLFVAKSDSQWLAVSSLCVGASMPASTGLRRICRLVDSGIATARRDPSDGRRTLIMLSDEAFDQLGSWLAGLREGMQRLTDP